MRKQKIGICIKCKRKRKIYAKGICNSCYAMKYYNKEKQNKASSKWREKNRDYWKDDKQRERMRNIMRKRENTRLENYRIKS